MEETNNSFTQRELDILKLIIAGKNNKEIGHELDLSKSTIKSHITQMLKKTEAKNRVHMAVIAVQKKII